MTQHRLSKGRTKGRSALAFSITFLVVGVVSYLHHSESSQWMAFMFFAGYLGIAASNYLIWKNFKNNQWSLNFEKGSLTIVSKGVELFKGSASELKYLDRDGDGYTLYLTPKLQFFLAHKDSSKELNKTLDQAIDFETY